MKFFPCFQLKLKKQGERKSMQRIKFRTELFFFFFVFDLAFGCQVYFSVFSTTLSGDQMAALVFGSWVRDNAD